MQTTVKYLRNKTRNATLQEPQRRVSTGNKKEGVNQKPAELQERYYTLLIGPTDIFALSKAKTIRLYYL